MLASRSDLATFPITEKWPARHPERLQLYSMPTPNGVKVAIMLEETGLPYEPHKVDFASDDQHSPAFLSLNPNNKIPAIIDPDGPGGKPLPLFESGAILLYLADKTGQLIPRDAAARYGVVQWLMFQVGGVGPMFGQLGYFQQFAGAADEDQRPLARYAGESRRLLGVLEQQLGRHAWVGGDDYTIADIAVFPWLNGLLNVHRAGDLVGAADFPRVTGALDAFLARPAVQAGLRVPS